MKGNGLPQIASLGFFISGGAPSDSIIGTNVSIGRMPPAVHVYRLAPLESESSPPLGPTLAKHLAEKDLAGRLDLGCVADHGIFRFV